MNREQIEEKYGKKILLEAYNIIKNSKVEINMLSEDKKLVETEMREKIAEIEELVDAKGKPNIAKVKAGLLTKAIDTYRTRENKLKNDLDTMENYLRYLKEKKIPKAKLDRYILLADEEKEAKAELSDNEKKLKDSLDPEIITAIKEIVTEEIKAEKEGEDNDKPNKDFSFMAKFYNVVGELKKIIKN
jgi:Glu-tRNA(Gln) amidotransferase subunit E-like FAD-binding protein